MKEYKAFVLKCNYVPNLADQTDTAQNATVLAVENELNDLAQKGWQVVASSKLFNILHNTEIPVLILERDKRS